MRKVAVAKWSYKGFTGNVTSNLIYGKHGKVLTFSIM